MPKAEDYKRRVDAILAPYLDRGQLRINARTPAEAVDHKARVTLMQKEIRLVKREMGAETKAIRAHYSSDIAQTGKGAGGAFQAGLFGRKNAGHLNAARKDQMRQEERATLAPFEQVGAYIDQILLALDAAKMALDRQIGHG